jgi:phosphoribosyl 1,2-cyclic phosphate phosphodiesterase
MSCGEMNIVLLGTGTSTGVPMLGCGCDVCRSTDSRDRRTRCSALVAWEGHHILIDTATDLRQQALRENITHVEAVLYTHAHADHVHGIDELRSFNMVAGGAIPIFGSAATLALIRRNFSYIFSSRQGAGFRPRLRPWTVGGSFCLCGLPIEPIPLRHGEGEALGYRIGSFAYLTDCSAVAKKVRPRLEGLDVLVVDGLRFRPHPTHFNIEQAVDLAQTVGARRTLLTHLCHEVCHARDSLKLPDGIELAYDGQRFRLPVVTATDDHAPSRTGLPGFSDSRGAARATP